jgi:beta-lactamase regulating signal transducer with metallopeptidase domain
MWNLLQDELGGGVWPRLLVALLDTGVKGLFLMAAAGLAAVALRRKAAAARHLVWMLALGGLLLLPVVSLLVPKWTLPLLPALEAPAPLVAPVVPSPIPVANATTPEIAPIPAKDVALPVPKSTPASAPLPVIPPSSTVAIPAPSSPNYAAWILAIWFAVALLSLAPFVAGIVAVSRVRRRATTFTDGALQCLATELAHSLGLKRPTRLLCGPSGSMPMATGLLRPAVFLPADALAWSEEKRRVVLLHELAHVKRRDCLAHAIARVAASLHWLNPLAWIALRQLRIEREHACDDLVLAAGERPSAYAESLLEIARTLRADTITAAAAITMAQKSQLEGRLLAVLDVARNRSLLGWKSVAGATLTALFLVVLLSSVGLTSSAKEPEVFEQTFASGVQIELVALSNAETGAARFYWRPDGTSAGEPPEQASEIGLSGTSSGDRQYRLAYFECQVPSEHYDISIQPRLGSYSAHHNERKRMLGLLVDVPRSNQTADVEIGVAAGPWQTVSATNFGVSRSDRFSGHEYSTTVGQPFTRDGAYQFILSHAFVTQQLRVVAVTKDGSAHALDASGYRGLGNTRQTDYLLDPIAPKDVARLEIQVREYDWRKFEGIAMNPYDDTLATVSLSTVPKTELPSGSDPVGSTPANADSPKTTYFPIPSPYSITRNAGRVKARSEDGRVLLAESAQSFLRIDAPNIRIDNRTDDQITLHADGSATDRPSVGVLMGSDGLNFQRLDLIHRIAAHRPAIDTYYIVQRGWDKALVSIPTPILVPEPMTRTEEWRNWQQTKDARKLEYMDELGRKYVLHGWGWAKSGIKLFPIIPRLERFRTDGTLEGWTSFHEEMPEATHFYEADGVTPAGGVLLRVTGIEGAPHVRNYTWRDSEGNYHQYDITPNGIIQYESLGTMVDGQGFDMDSFINQVKDGESMQVSFEADDVVRRIEIAGRADAPEKSLSTEVSVDPGTQKDRSPNAEDLVDERTVWGEVHNGLQAAIHIEPREGGYPIGETIDVTILLRNAGAETINVRTWGFLVPDTILVHDSAGNGMSTGNFRNIEFSSSLPGNEIAPGQVIEIKQYPAITFVDGPIDKPDLFPWTAIAVEPGVHSIQIQTRISPMELLGTSSTSLAEYWVGPLTTGKIEILIAPRIAPRGLQVRWVALDTDLGVRTLVPWRAGNRPDGEPTELSLHEGVLWSDADIAALEVVQGPVAEEFALQFQLTSEAGTRWEKATETSIGKRLALVLDGEVIYATTLNGAISGGVMLLTGSFDRAEADSLANAIRAANPGIASELKASGEGATLGPEIEVIVRHAGENCMIDFDTGKLFTPPDFNGTEDAFAWMAKNGIDAGGGNQEEVRGLIGMDLVLNPEANGVWDDAETNGALNHDAFKYGTPGNPVYLSAKGELPATWTFKTREGGRGIVQILGFEDEEPRGVKIRYRMMEMSQR